jgi:hypothetical protein
VAVEALLAASPAAAPSLLHEALVALLSRKMIVALTTKASILAIAWLSTKIDPHVATTLIVTVVPALTATGLGHMATQGWVDKAEAQGDAAGEIRAGIEAGVAKAAAPAVTA